MKLIDSKQLDNIFTGPLSEIVFQEILERLLQAKQEARMLLPAVVST